MTEKEKQWDKFDSMPFIAVIHHISRNKLRYAQKNPNHIDMVHEGRYLMEIHKRKDLSQDDLATIFGQSKGTIAKALRKLEDKEYVERIIDENNRRKYILKTTEKGLSVNTLQELLGHANITTTQIYTKVNNKEVKKALAKTI